VDFAAINEAIVTNGSKCRPFVALGG